MVSYYEQILPRCLRRFLRGLCGIICIQLHGIELRSARIIADLTFNFMYIEIF